MAGSYDELDVMQKIYELGKEILTTEEIKFIFLLATDSIVQTVWHVATRYGELDVRQKLFELAKEVLTTEEIKVFNY